MAYFNPDQPQAFLDDLMRAAIAAANPLKAVPQHLPPPPIGRTVVLGAGKASAAMAKAVEENWRGDVSGLIVTRHGFSVPCERVEIVEASHPVPDSAGREAASRILAMAHSLGPDDMCLALMSGGASALLTQPKKGISFEDKQEVNRLLLRSGANITEINTVRKHLSGVKGGHLARAVQPAKLVTLMISDVPGDDPGVIGSGPTVPDPTTFADARAVVDKYCVELPASVRDHLDRGTEETPEADDPAFTGAKQRIVARPQDSLKAAATVARAAGVEVITLSDQLEGEARDVARTHATMAQESEGGPRVYLSGGELTVTIRGDGGGGPNAEYMLSLALALDSDPRVHALAIDTDGIDGSEDNAGARITPDTLKRAQIAGLDANAYLLNNDSYGFFAGIDDLVMTGPTFTNVNDFRALLVLS